MFIPSPLRARFNTTTLGAARPNNMTNSEEIERVAHMLYLADLDYNGSGGRYSHLARAVIEACKTAQRALS